VQLNLLITFLPQNRLFFVFFAKNRKLITAIDVERRAITVREKTGARMRFQAWNSFFIVVISQ
jgi:hypothetical protein